MVREMEARKLMGKLTQEIDPKEQHYAGEIFPHDNSSSAAL
jgi:hypothetical protein